MRVLWITNIKLPPLSKELNEPPLSTGGWLYSSLSRIKEHSNIKIAVATFDYRNEIFEREIEGVTYYLLPLKNRNPQKYDKGVEYFWNEINKRFIPDLIHIHGTELAHGLAWIKACGNRNVLVSIQGLVSVISRYYLTGSITDYLPLTFRDLVRWDWISKQKKKFNRRGKLEKELLSSVNHIIGRTEWDKSHSWVINPKANYYHCGETLRPIFYNKKWKLSECIPNTIFISQGNYPIKGLHKVLEALPLILREYPNTVLYVGGIDIISVPWYRKTGYAKMIERLIRKYKLDGKVFFTGMLNDEEMCDRFLKSNVFVLPSAIENSPNSLGEAQLLNMPIVSSYCGGTPEIMGSIPSLYRYEEIEMLAYKVCSVFKNTQEALKAEVNKIYDPDVNAKRLIDIYSKIIDNDHLNN